MMRLASSGVRSSMLGLSCCSAIAANRGAGNGNHGQKVVQSSPRRDTVELSRVESSRVAPLWVGMGKGW